MPNPYGLIISLSILTSILFAKKLIQKSAEETLWGLSFWAIIFGILGARLYHVIDYFSYYSEFPLEIFKIWNGGLGIWGAIIGGAVGAVLYLKKKGENVLGWLDISFVVLPLGQAIGRWGNFFNQEIFGSPTNLPWGIYVNPENRPPEFLNQNKFHPLFIYESILNTILFLVLFKMYKRLHGKIPNGTFTAIYLGSYSIIRFFLEYLRINPWEITLGGVILNVSQCISILVLALSIVFIKRRKSKK